MSAKWIEERLGNAGLSRADFRGIKDGYDRVLLKVDKNGKVTEQWLDEKGKPVPAPTWRKE